MAGKRKDGIIEKINISPIQKSPTNPRGAGRPKGTTRPKSSRHFLSTYKADDVYHNMMVTINAALRGEPIGEMEPLNGASLVNLIKILATTNIFNNQPSDSKTKIEDEAIAEELKSILGMN